METKPGKTYYYIRVFQRDTENPEGDPEIAWTSPWFQESTKLEWRAHSCVPRRDSSRRWFEGG